MRGRLLGLLFLTTSVAGCGIGSGQPKVAPAPPPEKPHVESDLSRITLTDEAARSLGVKTKTPHTGDVQDQLVLPGWVMVPPGNEVSVTAPVAGYVLAGEGAAPAPGRAVKEKEVLFRLRPVLSPLEQIQLATLKRGVESEFAKARESVELAEKESKRIGELHKQNLRSQQDLEQAATRLLHAREDYQSARDKLDLFGKAAEKNTLPPIDITVPRSGTVLSVLVSPGQYVSAAAPLVSVADLTHLWLRVPVPEADLPRLARNAPASITFRSRSGQAAAPLRVPPVALVPMVDVARRTADVIYDLPSSAGEHGLVARDQMVQVGVPIDGRRNESLIPYSAVVYDAHAGAWIYLDRTAGDGKGRVYERRRVDLGPMQGEEVAVRPPCKPDDRVVVEGAGLLFSREFYKP